MLTYIIRRFVYFIPILIGINLITFLLFFTVNTPNDMARIHLGNKHVTQEAIENWKHQHHYDKPLFYASEKQGFNQLTDTLFFYQSYRLFTFQFGLSDTGRNICQDILQRMKPSLLLAGFILMAEVIVNINMAVLLVVLRETIIEATGLILCIVLMSISGLFYIITGQFVVAKLFRWAPISGYMDGLMVIKFLWLPIVISVVSHLGIGVRWYRMLLLEELSKAYVLTAYAKGLSEKMVLFKHVLRNALIPITTGVVVLIPMLLMGSLLVESFFAIPGLGNYMIDAIAKQDFSTVRVMVFLGSFLYVVGLLLTDIVYMWIDPRISL